MKQNNSEIRPLNETEIEETAGGGCVLIPMYCEYNNGSERCLFREECL